MNDTDTDALHLSTPDDPTPPERVLAARTETIRCSDYQGHRFSHRRLGRRWTCDTCHPVRP
jgi:hypothetical protein